MAPIMLEVTFQSDVAQHATQTLQSLAADPATAFIDLPDGDSAVGDVLVKNVNNAGSGLLISCLTVSCRALLDPAKNWAVTVSNNSIRVTRPTGGGDFRDLREGWTNWQQGGPGGVPTWYSSPRFTVFDGFAPHMDGAYNHRSPQAMTIDTDTRKQFRLGTARNGVYSVGGGEGRVLGVSPTTIIVLQGHAALLHGVYMPAGAHVRPGLVGSETGSLEVLTLG